MDVTRSLDRSLSGRTKALSLLPCATDCVLALGLAEVLAGRTHECNQPILSSVPVCTKPKLAPVSSVLSPTHTSLPDNASPTQHQGHSQATGMTPLETHMAQSTVKAAAWELCWGMGVGSAFGDEAAKESRGEKRGSSVSRGASLLVEWALSPFLTNTHLLQKLQPDVILTQLQPVEGAFTTGDIKAALEEVVGKPVMVVHLDPLSLPAVFSDMLRIGRSLGAEGTGREALREMRRRMGVVQSMCSGRERKGVLCLQWLDPVFTAGAWVPELIRLAGGIPVGPGMVERSSGLGRDVLSDESIELESDSHEAGEVAQEVTTLVLGDLTRKVHVMVVAICACNLESSLKQVQGLLQRQGNALAAVSSQLRLQGSTEKEGPAGIVEGRGSGCSVAVVDGDALFSKPGPALVPSLEVLAEILHPEIQGFGHKGHLWKFV